MIRAKNTTVSISPRLLRKEGVCESGIAVFRTLFPGKKQIRFPWDTFHQLLILQALGARNKAHPSLAFYWTVFLQARGLVPAFNLRRIVLPPMLLHKLDIHMASFERTKFARVGMRLFSAVLCDFHRADFDHVVITDSVFRCCDLVNTRFDHTRLRRVVFDSCNLRGADFRQARIGPGVDFRMCDLYGAIWPSDVPPPSGYVRSSSGYLMMEGDDHP